MGLDPEYLDLETNIQEERVGELVQILNCAFVRVVVTYPSDFLEIRASSDPSLRLS